MEGVMETLHTVMEIEWILREHIVNDKKQCNHSGRRLCLRKESVTSPLAADVEPYDIPSQSHLSLGKYPNICFLLLYITFIHAEKRVIGGE